MWKLSVYIEHDQLTFMPIWVSIQNPQWGWTRDAIARILRAIDCPKYFDLRQPLAPGFIHQDYH